MNLVGQILSFKINFQDVQGHILFAFLTKLLNYFIFIAKQKV